MHAQIIENLLLYRKYLYSYYYKYYQIQHNLLGGERLYFVGNVDITSSD